MLRCNRTYFTIFVPACHFPRPPPGRFFFPAKRVMIAGMIAVLQRVSRAEVRVRDEVVGSIRAGLLILLCAVKGDGEEDLAYLARKIMQLRVFEDDAGRMNRSVTDIGGGLLVVPQFTLAASVRKGTRPSFDGAEEPGRARELCEAFVVRVRASGLTVQTGEFGAMMEVSLTNSGPVTIIMDSREGRKA
jgi:D-tyrosyl-tRNA(Tyr) deacylase